jgi:hypothetical protein
MTDWDEARVQMIMRNEILDSLTCEVCEFYLDGITLSASDPRWTGELGQKAHPNCRMMLVPLFEGIAPVMDPTPENEIPSVFRHLANVVPVAMYDGGIRQPEGVERLQMHELTVEDVAEVLEPEDLIERLFLSGGE